MNTYNENLQTTVINTLAGIYNQQQALESVQTAAQYTLYNAQGAEITARDKLLSTGDQVDDWQNISDQAVINSNQMYNLLSSITDSSKVVATTITNSATAASNVQIASNAISVLAADIGAALNVATASLYETDVYSRIVQANSFINNVANDAQRVAKNAMIASAATSEIIASEVLTLGKATNTKVAAVLKTSQSQFTNFSNLAISENQDINTASVLERQAEGDLKDANRSYDAITSAYASANDQLNLGLRIKVLSGFEITAIFHALQSPLPTFKAPPASGIPIPDALPRYYLALLPAQNATLFFIDQATQLFQQAINPGEASSGFNKVLPTGATPLNAAAVAPNSPAILLSKDVYGNAVVAGQSYVAYIYTELSLQYKQYINNFSDLLSAPSQPFTPATDLPKVHKQKVHHDEPLPSNGNIWASLQFQSVPLAMSAKQAAQAAQADAEQAQAAVAAADAAKQAVSAAGQQLTSAQGTQTNANQTAQDSATLATKIAKDKASAAQNANIATQNASAANQLAVATNAAAVTATALTSAAAAANAAIMKNIVAPPVAAGASDASAPNNADAKGKSKAGNSTSTNANAGTSAADLLPLVAAAESASNFAVVANNSAAIVVTLFDAEQSPCDDDAVRNLAIATSIANAANAAANTAAAAVLTATSNAAAAAAAASTKGSNNTGATSEAASTAANAAQTSDAAAIAAAQANADVEAASLGLSDEQVVKANALLASATNSVALQVAAATAAAPTATPQPTPQPIGGGVPSDSAIAAELAPAAGEKKLPDLHAISFQAQQSSILACAVSASNASQAATNALNFCNSAAQATASANVEAELSKVAAALDSLSTYSQALSKQATQNSTTVAGIYGKANDQVARYTDHASQVASDAASAAEKAHAAAEKANSAAQDAVKAAIQLETAQALVNSTAETAESLTKIAEASAQLLQEIASKPPVTDGAIMAAQAAEQAPPQFRCILVQYGAEPNLNFTLSAENKQPPIFFNLKIAQQVSPANYIVATQALIANVSSPQTSSVSASQVSTTVDGTTVTSATTVSNVTTIPAAAAGTSTDTSTAPNKGFSNELWQVQFDATATDNFGNEILPGVKYQPYILTVVEGDDGQQTKFVDVLTTNFRPFYVLNPPAHNVKTDSAA